jgi:hypothetical protein
LNLFSGMSGQAHVAGSAPQLATRLPHRLTTPNAEHLEFLYSLACSRFHGPVIRAVNNCFVLIDELLNRSCFLDHCSSRITKNTSGHLPFPLPKRSRTCGCVPSRRENLANACGRVSSLSGGASHARVRRSFVCRRVSSLHERLPRVCGSPGRVPKQDPGMAQKHETLAKTLHPTV